MAAGDKKSQADSCYLNFKADYKSLYKAVEKVNECYTDNYLYILPLYNYNLDTNKQGKPWNFFASILSKTDTVINNAKDRETSFCPHISDIYMMRGIALLYQQNYTEACQLFDTMTVIYPNTKNGTDARLWQAHTAMYMGNYDMADSILQIIDSELDTTNTEFNKLYETILTDFFIKTVDYEAALNHLLHVEPLLSGKFQARAKFIIAQLYNQLGYYKEAVAYYDEVLQHRPAVGKFMKSYSTVYKHLCEKLLEEEQQRLLANKMKANVVQEEFEPTVVESIYDSSFFNMDYPYYFNDEAAMFFLDESIMDDTMEDFEDEDSMDYVNDPFQMHFTNEMLENMFENWDSISIHIPKTDFGSMTDTIYLPLIAADTDYILPHFNPVISRFGWRRYRYHYGVDTKNALGDSILCVFDGVVRIAKRNKTYGNVIIIRHYNGLETFYAHCSKLLVESSQEVKAGELIGLVGNTGRSSGPHLHFETRYKGAAFNPEYMIDFEKNKLISDTLVITKETFNYLRSGNSSSTVASPTGAVYYKIRSGDTLSGIAKKYKTNVNNIKRLNGMKSDFIREGQRIRVL
jgi:tetratricopeptide (TPR) repeat protein